jgi:hypothetical protein
MRRQRLVVVWLLALAAAMLFVFRPKGFGEAAFDRIEIGMTREEAKALVDEVAEAFPAAGDGEHGSVWRDKGFYAVIWDTRYTAVISFDLDGRVCQKDYRPRGDVPPTFLDRLRSWLPW